MWTTTRRRFPVARPGGEGVKHAFKLFLDATPAGRAQNGQRNEDDLHRDSSDSRREAGGEMVREGHAAGGPKRPSPLWEMACGTFPSPIRMATASSSRASRTRPKRRSSQRLPGNLIVGQVDKPAGRLVIGPRGGCHAAWQAAPHWSSYSRPVPDTSTS